MINVAIVEDTLQDAEILKKYLDEYSKSNNEYFEISEFNDAYSLLILNGKFFDCIFLDINLPGMSGIQFADKIRAIDKKVKIIFTTSLAQYAACGYKVDASDYLIKPFSYQSFFFSMKSVVEKIKKDGKRELILTNIEGANRIVSDEIVYIESRAHKIFYHTENKVIAVTGTMRTEVNRLTENFFLRCGSSYIINLRHIKKLVGFELYIGDIVIKISRLKKKEILQAIHNYIL